MKNMVITGAMALSRRAGSRLGDEEGEHRGAPGFVALSAALAKGRLFRISSRASAWRIRGAPIMLPSAELSVAANTPA